jgi:hypothetical protein
MKRYVGPMLIAVALVAVVCVGGVEKAQAAPGFFSFSVGSPGYGPAGYSAAYGSYPQPLPYYAPVPRCGPSPFGPVPYGVGYGPAAYGAYYRPFGPTPYYGHYGHHHGGYRGW